MAFYPQNGLGYSTLLRRELSARNLAFARSYSLPHCLSYGQVPVVVYPPSEDRARHGNFLPETYTAILVNPQWRRRLAKPHSQARTALPSTDHHRWCELDSSNSSDALLMNVFCHPDVFSDGRVRALLGVDHKCVPEFGVKARVPLAGDKFDRTEVDMRLGALLVESKLTEFDFQTKAKTIVETYRDFGEVFDRRSLPQSRTAYNSYQLIRNVLAAHAMGSAFCVIADARRPDLISTWYDIMRCVKTLDLRLRCKVLTWQELSEAVPPELQRFLAEKYGISTSPLPSPVTEDDI